MKLQLVILVAFIAVSLAKGPANQAAVEVEDDAHASVAAVNDQSQSDYQNDNYYQYRYAAPPMYMMSAYYNTLYEKLAAALLECAKERVGIIPPGSNNINGDSDIETDSDKEVEVNNEGSSSESEEEVNSEDDSKSKEDAKPDSDSESSADESDSESSADESDSESSADESDSDSYYGVFREAAKATDSSMCGMAADSGPCRTYVQRYYFNKESKKCERFTYGGCRGNANNFETEKECAASCSCSQSPATGPCNRFRQRYYFNSVTNKCQKFSYGGCAGNGNNFLTEKDCLGTCACQLPAHSGLCRAAFSRWYHNASTGQCYQFVYGGCGGNSNNFLTREECQSTC